MRPRPKTRTMVRTIQAPPSSFNANTIVGMASALIGGVVLYMVTTGMGKVSQTSNDVKEVKIVLPFFQESLKELKGDVKNVQTEQTKVREDLLQQSMNQQKPK